MSQTSKHDHEHTLYLQVETHSGGSRKRRGISSYQVEDDFHGGETHARGLDLNFVWLVYLFVCPSGDDHSRGRWEERGPGRAPITQDTSPKQSPLDSKSTRQSLHLTTSKQSLLRITVGLIEYPESIECSVPPAMNHDY